MSYIVKTRMELPVVERDSAGKKRYQHGTPVYGEAVVIKNPGDTLSAKELAEHDISAEDLADKIKYGALEEA